MCPTDGMETEKPSGTFWPSQHCVDHGELIKQVEHFSTLVAPLPKKLDKLTEEVQVSLQAKPSWFTSNVITLLASVVVGLSVFLISMR